MENVVKVEHFDRWVCLVNSLLSSLRTSLQHGVRRNRAKYGLRTVQRLERQERAGSLLYKPWLSDIPRWLSEIKGAYHLARKSGNFGLKSNGKVIFRKFRSEIVEYLQRYSSFSVRNGTAEISLPFAKLSSFQSLISRKQLREIEVQMVSAISFGWFADFGKTLTIIQRSSQPVYSDKW